MTISCYNLDLGGGTYIKRRFGTNTEANFSSITTILTDLSDVLIGGMIGLDNIVANTYGKCASDEFSDKFAKSYPYFNDLMRGTITESGYWKFYSEVVIQQSPLASLYIKELFMLNMQKSIPGTLELYKGLTLPNGLKPKYFIISDHIREYSNMIKV